jgi:hypothetical protein
MEETTKSEVERILRKSEDKTQERVRNEEKRKQDEASFKAEFSRLRKDVIRPTMEEIGLHIKKLGHNYYILDTEMTISLYIIPSGKDRYEPNIPRISFETWPGMEIRLKKEPYGYDQKVKNEDITKSFVEQNIIEVMKNWEEKFLK